MEFENFEDFVEEMISHMRSNDSDAISLDRLEYYMDTFAVMKKCNTIPLIEYCPKCNSEKVFNMYPNHYGCSDCLNEWDGRYMKEKID